MKMKILAMLLMTSTCYANDDIRKNFVKEGIGYFDAPKNLSMKIQSNEIKPITDPSYINFLMNIETEHKATIHKFAHIDDPGDTNMKYSLAKIKLANPYKFPLDEKSVIGYAPVGVYENGWTGVKVFFKHEIGICTFQFNNIKAMMLPRGTPKIINDKLTSKWVKGNSKVGYLYGVKWSQENADKTVTYKILECVTWSNRTNEVFPKMFSMAKTLD